MARAQQDSGAPIQPGQLLRHQGTPGYRQSGLRGYWHVLRGASEPHDEDEHAPIHSADECLLEELENHYHALSLYFVFYNFMKTHKTLRVTPAMAAGLTTGF